MNDDWRLQIEFEDEGHIRSLAEHLDAGELEHEIGRSFHDRVIVSREGAHTFLYAATRKQAESARDAVTTLAAQHGWQISADLKHWHPAAEEWEDPDRPLPEDDAARKAEHEALIAAERAETEKNGYPEFEVRVDLPSHQDALRFTTQLREEGLPVVHRARYLLIGTTDEDCAKVLAERLRSEAPPGSKVQVEGTWRAAFGDLPPNPFAIFGGLGG